MKSIMVSILILFCEMVKSQAYELPPVTNEPDKSPFRYIVIYNRIEEQMQRDGFSVTPARKWVQNVQGFNTLADLQAFLDMEYYAPPSGQLIGVWDLSKMKKVEAWYKRDTIVTKRQVIQVADTTIKEGYKLLNPSNK